MQGPSGSLDLLQGPSSRTHPSVREHYEDLVAFYLEATIVPRATPGLSCRELLPVYRAESYSRSCCAESYSQSIVTRATFGLLCRELLPSCCDESYSRVIVPRATPGLSCWYLCYQCVG